MEREKSLDQMDWGELYTIFDEYCSKRGLKPGPSCTGCPCKKLAACKKLLRDLTIEDLIEAVKTIEGAKA